MASSESTEISFVFFVSIFLGVILFLGTSGASDFIDLEGTDDFEEVGSGITEEDLFTVFDYVNSSNIEEVNGTATANGDESYEGISWNGNGDYGYAIYDFTGINEIRFDVYDSSFIPSAQIEFYDNVSGEKIGDYNGGWGDTVSESQTFDISNTSRIEVRFNNPDSALVGFNFVERNDGEGFLDRLFLLVSIFSVESDSLWFQYLIGIPLGIVGLYLLLRYAGDYIPFT